MSSNNFKNRKYQAFMSHAHVDKEVVEKIYSFLKNSGISVWYDSESLSISSGIASGLAKGIEDCKSMIIIVSNDSLGSGWVEEERDFAIDQQKTHKEFKIIPIVIEEIEVNKLGFLKTKLFIEVFDTGLDINFYSRLLYSFYNLDTSKLVNNTKDIYVSRSWRENELALAQQVSNYFIEKDFWLIGDLEENTSYSDERVASIMRSCGGLLSIVPDRGNGEIPKYHKKELDIATRLNLPILIVSDSDLVVPNELNAHHIKIENLDKFDTEDLFLNGFYNFSDDWKKPSDEQFIFYATNLNDEFRDRNETVKKLSEIITARECIMGEEIRTGHIQQNIVDNIKKSFLVLADISENRLNTCIEVGIARGANKNIKLISKGPRESPPFMFRDLQVHHYDKDEELLAYVHKLLLPYRRRVLNLE